MAALQFRPVPPALLLVLLSSLSCDDESVAPPGSPPGPDEPSAEWVVDSSPVEFHGIVSNGRQAVAVSEDATYAFDGTSWNRVAPGLRASSLTMSPDGAVFAVQHARLWRLNGTDWELFFTPTHIGCDIRGNPVDELGDLWAGEAGNLFVIGPADECGYVYFSVHFQYDGTEWTEQWSGSGIGSAVWGASADDVFVAGYDGIYRFDGASWSMMGGGPARVSDMWGRSASDVYAIDSQTIYHFNGTSWTTLYTHTAHVFRQIGELEDGTLVVWGHGGQFVARVGTQWVTMSVKSGEILTGVWGPSLGDLWVSTSTGMLHVQGNSIQRVFGGPDEHWHSVWAADDGNVFVVGENEAIARRSESGWEPMGYRGLGAWRDVWGRSSSDVYAVGDEGRMVHFNGFSWVPLQSITFQRLTALWGNVERLFVAGEGVILEFDGVAWRIMPGVPDIVLNDIWGASARDVFAVGDNGTILHFDGLAWTSVDSGHQKALRGVWGRSGTDVFAVGDWAPYYGPTRYYAATILHYDGVEWTRMSTPHIETARAIWGSGDVMLVAGDGIFPLLGSGFGASVGPYAGYLHGSSPSRIFALAAQTIYRYEER